LLAVVLGACGEDPSPAFPADYAVTFDEVRDCRGSADHDLHNIRVLADALGAPAYLDRDAPFPEGAVILKEEYGFADATCEDELVQWTVMTKLADGASPGTLDWAWQRVGADRGVISEDDPRCVGCHQDCGVAPDGFAGTCAVP